MIHGTLNLKLVHNQSDKTMVWKLYIKREFSIETRLEHLLWLYNAQGIPELDREQGYTTPDEIAGAKLSDSVGWQPEYTETVRMSPYN